MTIKFNFALTDTYANRITDLNDTFGALAKNDFVGTESGLPSGAIRLNSSKWQSWNGATWSDITLANNISGNAGTVTNGVYTTGNQTIAGIKSFSDSIAVDTINEKTSANGILVDGVRLKDGGGMFTSTVNIGNFGRTATWGLNFNTLNLHGRNNTASGALALTTKDLSDAEVVYGSFWHQSGVTYLNSGVCSVLKIGAGSHASDTITITSDGKVGIGTTPSYLLHAKGSQQAIMIESTANSDAVFKSKTALCEWSCGTGVGIAENCWNIYNHTTSSIPFIVKSNNNVGIGTTSPKEKLHVSEGNLLNSGTYGSSPTLSVSGAGTRMFFYPRKSAFRAGYVNGTQWDDGSIGNYSTAFGYNTIASGKYSFASGYDTKASYDNSTAFGYGTTASGSVSTAVGLHTTASGDYSLVGGCRMQDNDDSAFMWGRSGSLSTTDYNIKTWRNSSTGTKYGTLKGTWDINGAAITSDIRLKENIKSIDSALDKINLINPVTFEWKRPEVRHELDTIGEYGVIAQELQKVFPELITHRPTEDSDLIPDNVQLGVKYTGLIAPMIKAIQELTSRLEILEKKG